MSGISKIRRLEGIDIVRTLAVLCVICGHFFSVNTPYNQTAFEGASMYLQGYMKSVFCNLGVPFFLLLSGYLCCHKTLSSFYYRGLSRVLIPYVVISIITWLVLSDTRSVGQLVMGILGFKTIGYAWYVEMYLGLFLLIPFVNAVLREVFGNGWTKHLLITLLLMTSLPALVNRNGITLVPGFWTMMFPLTYYVIGATIRQYEPHLKSKYLGVFCAMALFAIGPISESVLYKVSGGCISSSVSGGYYSLINVAASSLLFLGFYDLGNLPKWLSKAFEFCALAAFETFLFSYLFDKLLYPVFLDKFYISQSQFIVWFIPITATVFSLSLMASYLYKESFQLITLVAKHVKNRGIR